MDQRPRLSQTSPPRNLKVVFLCSGNGGNLRFLHHAMLQRWLAGWDLAGVVCDRPCPAATYASAHGIPVAVMDFSPSGQVSVLAHLAATGPDLVVTTIHRILTPEMVKTLGGRLVNLHYSLLPAFGGTIGEQPVKQALAYGVKFCGVTVHQVSDQVDAGRPLVQAVVPVSEPLVYQELMQAIFQAGCLALLSILADPDLSVPSRVAGDARSTVALAGHAVHFNPAVVAPSALESAAGWDFLKT